MFYLHASNKTENLLHHLATLVEADPLVPFAEEEIILIQSQGMERMISQYMAKHFTCWCNYRFFLPLTLLEAIAEKFSMAINSEAFTRETLCWRIEEKLRDLEGEEYQSLRGYLQGGQIALKRFQLARQLAHLFDQYQLMRPHLLRNWKKGRAVTGNLAEQWQMQLWNSLINDSGDDRTRGEQLFEIISFLEKNNELAGLPRRISVFGVHLLPPLFLDYLKGLAQHLDIHFFLLSPCENYWGDMIRRPIDHSVDSNDPGYHPLLVSLGGQGRDFHEMLLERGGFASEFFSYENPFNPDNPRLLHAVQADLLNGSIEMRKEGVAKDSSLRVISCHSRERELAILKDHLIHLLENEKELQLSDIVVMAPDIQDYAPFIPTHFGDIQHSIADRSILKRNTTIALFQQFLDLLSGRFGWSEVLDLLDHEQVQRKFQITPADLELVRNWIKAAGVRWGLSGKTRKEGGFSFAENSWQAGLERLLMGVVVDADEEVAGVLPYSEIEGSQARALGGICEFIALIEQAEADFRREHSLRQWAELFEHYSNRLFHETASKDFLELRRFFRSLDENGSVHRGDIPLRVMSTWFSVVATESRSSSGFLKGGVTFCSMLPMRSIPFKAICVIGLNYGEFPESDRQPNYDLMKQQSLLGDRSLRADDRYQFLELLLACRQWLYLSYQGNSLENNDVLPPSVVLTEFLEILEQSYGVRDLVERHPLHGFSSKYFSKNSNFFSYSDKNYHIAHALAEESVKPEGWWQGALEGETNVIELADVFRFFAHPQRYFIEQSLDISLSEPEREPEETELLEISGLDAYGVEQQLLTTLFEDADVSRLKRKLRESGGWPLGVVGEVMFAQKNEEISLFAQQLNSYNMGQRRADLDVDISIEGYTLVGRLGHLYENGFLLCRYGRFRAKDLLIAWLYQLIGDRVMAKAPQTRIATKDVVIRLDAEITEFPNLEDLLRLYLQGRRAPCRLLLEPALAYCRQLFKQRAKNSPLFEARKTYADILTKGYESSWQLLYQQLSDEQVINEDFTLLTERYLLPMWRVCHGR